MGLIQTKSSSLKLPKNVKILRQTYERDALPDKVEIIKLNVFPDDQGGWFKENLRSNTSGEVEALKEVGINFKVLQSNCSYIAPNSRRFWHIHPNKEDIVGQNEIWTSNATLLVGLIDLRKNSKTNGLKSKVVLSRDKALYIPSGVAHGLINPNKFFVTLVYFADKYFRADEKTQENRIDPKEMSFEFVEPETM